MFAGAERERWTCTTFLQMDKTRRRDLPGLCRLVERVWEGLKYTVGEVGEVGYLRLKVHMLYY